jgi:hypothetical protein
MAMSRIFSIFLFTVPIVAAADDPALTIESRAANETASGAASARW